MRPLMLSCVCVCACIYAGVWLCAWALALYYKCGLCTTNVGVGPLLQMHTGTTALAPERPYQDPSVECPHEQSADAHAQAPPPHARHGR